MADKKITELAELLIPSNDDILPIVDDPAGSPITKKITLVNLLAQLILAPTDLKVSTASKGGLLRSIDKATGDIPLVNSSGWVEDEKYGWYVRRYIPAISVVFDSTVKRTGRLTLKVSDTDGAGTAYVYTELYAPSLVNSKHLISVKPNTTYRYSCYAKTTELTGSKGLTAREYDVDFVAGATRGSNGISQVGNWELLTMTFTTAATCAYLNIYISNGSGAISDTWYDVNSMTLEEVVTDTSFTGKVAEKIRPVLQAVTSTDTLDQNLDALGAYANTYTPPVAVNEGATHRQTYTPTKKYTTQIGVWVVDNGTGDWTLIVHDAANVLLAQSTIVNASVTEGAMLYFDVPNIWASGALHFHVISSVADGTLKTNTSNDEEAASYIQRYAKRSENFTIVCNGVKTQLKADKDGILANAIIDLDNGKYKYTNPFNVLANFTDIFSATAGGGSTIPDVISGWDWTNTLESISSVSGATAQSIVFKVNTILPIKHLKISTILFNNNVAAGQVAVSSDNVNYIDLVAQLPASASAQTKIPETDLMNGLLTFYLKIYKSTEDTVLRIDDLQIEADLDTSSIPTGLLYPIATNQFTETVKLPATASRVYFQLAKYTNEYGVIVPCLEFTDTTPTVIGYVPLKLDNSRETSPCVRILSTTTNYQASGTGSESGGYILNTGEYLTLTGAVAELSIDYQVGTGTTAFANITKNTLFLSSNAESAESTQDPSHQMNAIVGVRQQGLLQRIGDIGEEVAQVRNGVVKISSWAEWIPTLTWSAAPGTNVVTKARYKIVDGVCYFNFYYKADDGNGATTLTISLPVPPKDNDSFITLVAQQKVDTTWSDPLAYIDDGATTITFRNLSECTDAVAVIVQVSGSYEI